MLCCNRVAPSVVGIAYELGAGGVVYCNYVALQVMLEPIYLPSTAAGWQIAHTEHAARGIVKVYGYVAGGFLGYYTASFKIVSGYYSIYRLARPYTLVVVGKGHRFAVVGRSDKLSAKPTERCSVIIAQRISYTVVGYCIAAKARQQISPSLVGISVGLLSEHSARRCALGGEEIFLYGGNISRIVVGIKIGFADKTVVLSYKLTYIVVCVTYFTSVYGDTDYITRAVIAVGIGRCNSVYGARMTLDL